MSGNVGGIICSYGPGLCNLITIRTNSVIDLKQEVMKVEENNKRNNNKHRGNSVVGSPQCKDFHDRSFVWNMNGYVEVMSVDCRY